MAFLGYALFTGKYGKFTIPVLELTNFTLPSGLSATMLNIASDTYNAIAWNYVEDIYNLVPNPQSSYPSYKPEYKDAFEAQSTPVLGLVAADQTAKISGANYPDDFYPAILGYENGQYSFWEGTVEGGNTIALILKLPEENNSYFFMSEYSRTDLDEGIMAQFILHDALLSRALTDIVIQPNPVLIGSRANFVNFYLASPERPIVLKRGESVKLQFEIVTAEGLVFGYDDVIYDTQGYNIDITNNVVTIPEQCSTSELYITAKPNIPDTPLFSLFSIEVPDYLPYQTSDPYIPGGATMPGGGGGNFGKNEISDSIEIPGGTTHADASDSGIFTRYAMNTGTLKAVGEWLWTSSFGLTIAKSFISLLYGNPADSIISLMSYPFALNSQVNTTTEDTILCWGGHKSGISATKLTSSSATINWGSVQLYEYWGNFLDYSPHTKVELYLPWGTGFVSIDPGQCLPGSLSVTTNVDLNKGSCVHNVFGNGGVVIGTYSGQCGMQVPLMSSDSASKMVGMVVSAVAAGVSATAGGEAKSAGARAAIDYGATHSLPFGNPYGIARYKAGLDSAVAKASGPHAMTQKAAGAVASGSALAAFRTPPTISRNGGFTDGSSGLGPQYPYVIVSRPTQSVPASYGHHFGYPCNIDLRLGDLKGYTEIGEIHLQGISGTEAEVAEIDKLLKGGVVF